MRASAKRVGLKFEQCVDGGMPASYLPYEPDQDFLLTPSLSEWLPEGHLAYFTSDSVDAMDLSAFHAQYDKGGPRNQPFHPAMMVKVLLYAHSREDHPAASAGVHGSRGQQQLRFHADRKPHSAARAAKLRTPEGQAAYRKRKWIAEPPNGGSKGCWASGSSACEACTG